jgi:hypothetical protein
LGELAIVGCLWPGKLYGLEMLRRLESDSDLVLSAGTVGDIVGEGHVEYLMMYRSHGPATFVGLKRIVGRPSNIFFGAPKTERGTSLDPDRHQAALAVDEEELLPGPGPLGIVLRLFEIRYLSAFYLWKRSQVNLRAAGLIRSGPPVESARWRKTFAHPSCDV